VAQQSRFFSLVPFRRIPSAQTPKISAPTMATEEMAITQSSQKRIQIDDVKEEMAITPSEHPMMKLKRGDTTMTWVSHFHSAETLLQVSNAAFAVKSKDGMKKILKDVSFTAQNGQLLALMGPSGAGKTTLLEYVNLNLKGGEVTGSMTLNGQPFTGEMFSSHAAFVEQYDTHWGFLTGREILTYASRLQFAQNHDTTSHKSIEEIMTKLGLNECANTKVGNKFLKGISGGQKKRLSLAIALLKGPSVLLLDEPTSGLDAASTKAVMAYLVDLAKDSGTIIIATIHQPATEVFMSFSKVMFLVAGKLAYFSSPKKVEGYVKSIGKPLPVNTNPADFFLMLVNNEFVDKEEVDKVVNAWKPEAPKDLPDEFEPLVVLPSPNLCKQAMVLFRRHLILSIRDPTMYIGRMFVFLLANAFFAIIYVKARTLSQEHVTAVFFVCLWFLAATTMFNVVAVYAVNEEFFLIKKEIRNGMCSRNGYITSRFFLQIPYIILLALFAILIPGYAIMGFGFDGFPVGLCVMASCLWAFECLAEALAVSFANPLIGMLGAVSMWFTCFLFCGAFLEPDFIIWPFRALTYVLPLRWSIQTLCYTAYRDTKWEGAVLSESPLGYTCTSTDVMDPCYGYTGEQVLLSLKKGGYGCVSAEDTVAGDIRNVLLFGLFCKIVFIVMVYVKIPRLTSPPAMTEQADVKKEESKEESGVKEQDAKLEQEFESSI